MGGEYGNTARFELAQSKREFLDDLTLDTLLTEFQRDRNCDSLVVFIESCFAGSFAKQLDSPGRRVVVMAERDKYACYSRNGENSFTSLLMDRLEIPWSLGKSFRDVKVTMKNRAFFKKQEPLLDADGDGVVTWSESDLVDDFYVGGLSSKGARPPSIISHTRGGLLKGESVTLEVKASSLNALDSAWVSIVRPDFNPEKIADYFTGEKDRYEQQVEIVLMNESPAKSGKFTCTWQNYDIDGRYEAIFHVRDEKGITSASDPVIFRQGNTPFIRPETDKSIYTARDQIQLKLSLGGSGAADVYGVLFYPDGTFHALILDSDSVSGFKVTEAVNIEAAEAVETEADSSKQPLFPVLVPDLSLFELNRFDLLTLDQTGLLPGEYTWYMVLARPDTDLLQGNWHGFDTVTFYLDKAAPMQAKAPAQEGRSDAAGAFASSPFIGTGRAVDPFPGTVDNAVSFWDTDDAAWPAPVKLGGTTSEYAYAWYLENHELNFGSWCDFTTLEKSVEYPSLPPGAYTFHVKAKTRVNQVSNEAVRSFSVTSVPHEKEMKSFTVTPSSGSVKQGDSFKLTATAAYSDGTSEDVSSRTGCRWTSKSPSIAAVDASGSVRGVARGTAEITASYQGFEASASIDVRGEDPEIPTNVGVVNVSPSAMTLETRGETQKITATAIFTDGTQQVLGADMNGVLWESSNPGVASVDSTGNVTAISNGTSDITCTYGYQTGIAAVTGTAAVTVAFSVLTGLRLDPAHGATLDHSGDVASFKVFGVYSKGPEMEVTQAASWAVDNGGIASVDSAGTVTALSEGSTGLTASFGGFTVSCNINVVFPHPALSVSTTEITLTATKGTDGSAGSFDISNTGTGSMAYTLVKADDWLGVSPESGTVNEGQTVTVTVTPSASGKETGTYSGVITVTASGTIDTPQYITVNLEVTNSLGMSFKKIPAGTFMMGSPEDEPERERDETRHQVTLTQDYYMQTTEVTQGQWVSVMGSNPSRFDRCGDKIQILLRCFRWLGLWRWLISYIKSAVCVKNH